MTRTLARALLRWHQTAETHISPLANTRLFNVYLAKGLAPAVFEHLVARYGAGVVYVTDRGAGLDRRWVDAEVARAEAMLARRRRPKTPVLPMAPPPLPPAPKPPLAPPVPARGPTVPPLSVAWPLCDGDEAARRFKQETAQRSPRHTVLKALRDRPLRHLPRAGFDQIRAVSALAADFPHFSGFLDALVRQLHLQRVLGGPVHLAPTLLLGPPGIGKTALLRRLAAALGLAFRFQSLADTTGAFLLTGLGEGWGDARPGVIAQTVAGLPDGRGLLIGLDELDKCGTHRNYPIDAALLGLLEPASARRFRDENLELELDLSPVSFVLTANRLDGVRPELCSRLSIVEVEPPTDDQMPAVVRSVDAELRGEMPELARAFRPLDAEVIAQLRAGAPRALRRTLEEAYARACAETATAGQTSDTPLSVLPRHFDAAAEAPKNGPHTGAFSRIADDPRQWPLLVLPDAWCVH